MLNTILLAVSLIIVAIIFLPNIGLLARWQRYRRARDRIIAEDALKHLHACEWRGQTATLESLTGALRLAPHAIIQLVQRLESQGWIRFSEQGLRLTPDGEHIALAVIRAHRLWERYLADEARMPLTAIHEEAEQREHNYDAEHLLALEEVLGHPRTDPHGDPIPTAAGNLKHTETCPLTAWQFNTPAQIIHIEDEPASIFAQIVAQGLRPGQIIRVIEANKHRLVISDGEHTHTLAPIVAANIFVAPDGVKPSQNLPRLTALRRGQRATIHALDESLQGFTRRRLLDLGLTPGAIIVAELPNMFGDPIAYRVRGSLIALRHDQAEHVLIENC